VAQLVSAAALVTAEAGTTAVGETHSVFGGAALAVIGRIAIATSTAIAATGLMSFTISPSNYRHIGHSLLPEDNTWVVQS
jgi:hypothetical protein